MPSSAAALGGNLQDSVALCLDAIQHEQDSRYGTAKSGPETSNTQVGAKDLSGKRTFLWIIAAIAFASAIAVVIVRLYMWKPRLTTIQGAVIRADKDPNKQTPIPDVEVTASRGLIATTTRSDASGYFRITFPQVIWPGETVTLKFTQADYHPLTLNLKMEFRSTARRLVIAEMKPLSEKTLEAPAKSTHTVSNLRIRYTVSSQSEENIGSAARTFQVENQGDVPCRRQGPCSPDGDWKAAEKSITLDAGLGNEYRDVRASCIAGPCPFTRITTRAQGRTIVATALDWSDTATFLLEAEVFHTSLDSNVRESYPVIFDRNLSFTLPPTQEGVSIEAEIDGTPMVFPLGPDIYLSWATCDRRISPGGDKSIVYQCELKPGYIFPK